MASRLLAQAQDRLAKADEADPAATAAGPDAAALSPSSLPAPYAATADGDLSTSEHADLGVCEAALDNLRVAFWAAGKALQVIRDARLYRGSHATFEEYVAQRWDMSRAHAYRLIEAWPLAECLSPIGDTLNESQVRELLPLAGRHGQDAAVTVYQTIAAAEGVQVTAALLHGAVAVLPPDHFDADEAVRQIRAYLAAGTTPPPQPASADAVAQFTAVTTRLRRTLQQATARRAFKTAAQEDPDGVRRAIAEMRTLLDEIEQRTF